MMQELLKFVLGQPVPFEETRNYEFKEIKGGKPINSIKNTSEEYVVAFLNTNGGGIFFGVRDADRCVAGINLPASDRDDLRRVVFDKLMQIRPPIAPTAYQITLHPVYADDISTEPLADVSVVEIVAPKADPNVLYSTGGNDVFVRTDSGRKKLTIEEIQDEIRRREASRRPTKGFSSGQEARYPGQLPTLPSKLKSDRKNILQSASISERLLRGDPPSLAECVMASRTIMIEVEDKNRPVGDWFPYNHFFAPSAVFSVRDAGSRRLVHLGYTRAAQPRDPGYRLTTGAAILWNASYNYNVAHEKDAPMDLWIERLGQDRDEALQMFAGGPKCTLLQLLRYKIELVGLHAVCKPFGVITIDLRNPGGGRVYTFYAFHVTLAASAPEDISMLLSRIRVRRGGHLYTLAADFRGDEFLGHGDKKNPVEYLAWEALHNDEPTLSYERTRFTRGFVIG